MAKKSDGEKKRISITSLDDLQPRDVDVEIERGNEVLVIPCRTLTYGEFQRLGYAVIDPAPPVATWNSKGAASYNYNDPQYLTAKQQAADERLYLRLLAFLKIDVPGDTPQEKIDNLQNTLEVDVVRALTKVMLDMVSGGEARVTDRATTFHST